MYLAVVPALLGDGVGLPLPHAVPLVDAVLFHDGTLSGEWDRINIDVIYSAKNDKRNSYQ